MRTTKTMLLLCLLLVSCKKTVDTKDIIREVQVDPLEVPGDGSTIVTISVFLNDDLDRRSVLFRADKGSFVTTEDGKNIEVTAEKVNNVLTAIAQLKAPSTSGIINLTVQPNIPDLDGQYVVRKTVNVTNSEPSKITLSANSFRVYNNFEGEIELTGILTNSKNRGVSSDIDVIVEDYDSNFNRINGAFRNNNLTTKLDSKVSTIYSPGAQLPNQFINIVATVLNSGGNKTVVSDTLKIYVAKKE